MAKKEPLSRSKCFNHDDRLSVIHCGICMKPVCSECVVKDPVGTFCSVECKDKALKAVPHVEELVAAEAEFKAADRANRMRSTLIQLGIALLILIAVYCIWNYAMTPDSRTKFIEPLLPYLPFLENFM